MPKYSIILPTYNSAKYLKTAIDSVLACNYDDYEFIISNNCSTDETDEILSQIHDDHIRIIKPSETLPLGAHWNFAIKHATGEWLWALGADDAILPYFFELCDKLTEYCDKHKINIIKSIRALYFWSGVENTYGNNHISFLFSPRFKICSSIKSMKKILTGQLAYVDMPQMYITSLFRKKVIKKAKKTSKTADIIPYNVPAQDAYLGLLSGIFEKKYLYTDIPLGWAGSSTNSMIFKFYEKKLFYKDSSLSQLAGSVNSMIFHMYLAFLAFIDNNTVKIKKYKKELEPLNILPLVYYTDLYKLEPTNPRVEAFWEYIQSLGISKKDIIYRVEQIEKMNVKPKWHQNKNFIRLNNFIDKLNCFLTKKDMYSQYVNLNFKSFSEIYNTQIKFQYDSTHLLTYSEINDIVMNNNFIKNFFRKCE